MSENVLRSLMQLFAILGKLEAVPGRHRALVRTFLSEYLNLEHPEGWLTQYEEYLATYRSRGQISGQGRLSVKDATRLLTICTQINEEVTQRQKTMVLFVLFSFLKREETLEPEELEFLISTADIFNISRQEYGHIESFALGRRPVAELAEEMVYIGHANAASVVPAQARFIDEEELGEGELISVLRMAQIGMYLVQYQATESETEELTPVYLNGAQMRPDTIYAFDTGSSLRAGRNRRTPIYYSDVISKFMENHADRTLTFEAQQITFKFAGGKVGLHPFTLREESGSLLGLMGPSGAGKSTLLEVLNGNLRPSSGQVMINGKDLYAHKGLFKGVIGYVPQDDLLIEELTVHDNLYYAAKLAFGAYSPAQLTDLVDKTLTSLGLAHIGALRVGSPLQKTISGGERKRVNIGLELLRAPQVMFVDEPTSGLSSRDSVNVMELLKELTVQGKLIFVVIHQPSSDIYKLFDRLVILDTGGYPIYYGNPIEAVRYFKTRANHIDKDDALCHECGNVNPEQIFDIVETRLVNEYGRYTAKRRFSPTWWYEQYQQFVSPPKVVERTQELATEYKKAPILRQLFTFITRDVKAKLHNQQYLLINLLEAPALALLLAYVFKYYKADELSAGVYTFADNDNIAVYLFISIIVALFLGLTVSAEEIYKDRKILKREAFLHLSRHAYFTSKVAILFTISAIQTAIFVWLGNSILEIRDMNVAHWAVLFSASCFANMLGLNISQAFNSAITIYILIPILLIPQLVLGGLVIKFDQINPDLRDGDAVPVYGELMASRWAYEALLVHQYMANPFAAPLYGWDKTLCQTDYKKTYLLPVLEGKIEYVDHNAGTRDVAVIAQVDRELAILQRTLADEQKANPGLKLGLPVPPLTFKTYSKASSGTLRLALEALRVRYNDAFNRAYRAKDAYVLARTRTPEAKAAYVAASAAYTNSGVAELVKNTRSSERIAQEGNTLVQKIFPIYHTPEGKDGFFNFRTHFYAPFKHIAGYLLPTLAFNIGVLWVMCAVLYAMLYHGTLSRFVKAFGRR